MTGRCLSCRATDVSVALSLGPTPLANALRDPELLNEPEVRYPLDLAVCQVCSLAQLAETVPPTLLFADYPYFSSYSETMLRHAEGMAVRLIERHGLGARSLVVELGSNDGYLLQYFQQRGIDVLGIDPAEQACELARHKGVPARAAFFGSALAKELVESGRRADLIVANNVMAHVPDINDVVQGISQLLAPTGVFVMETPYVKDLIDRLEFDTIYHEHVFYYSLTALDHLMRRHGLAVIHVERLPIHGGSLRVTAAPSGQADPSAAVKIVLSEEAAWGVSRFPTYADFAERVSVTVTAIRRFLEERKASGHRLAGYGAAAKATMLLAAIGGADTLLDFVVDRNPRKQGRCVPGTRLLVHAPEHLLHEMPDELLLFTWNIADEIVRQQAEYRRRGGRFILPIPEPRIVAA